MKTSNSITLTVASLSLGLGLGLLLVGGSFSDDVKDEDGNTSRHRQATRRVIPSRDGLGISSFLARNARHESLPIGYLDKREVMQERQTSPFRLQAVLYHHMDNLTDSEMMDLIANQELVTDREVKLAYNQLAQEDPGRAVDMALAHSKNLHQRLLAMRTAYASWAQQDPKAMFDYIAQLDTGGQRMIHKWHMHLAWERTDPAGMTQNYTMFPKNEHYFFAKKAIQAWVKKDPQAASEYVSNLDNPEEKSLLGKYLPNSDQ